MPVVGVLLGLGAASFQSLSYIFSRLFVIKRHRAVVRLLVLSHVWMGAASCVLLPLAWPVGMPPVSQYALPVFLCAAFYVLGQAGLFVVLRSTDASRVSPLLGLKVAMLAAISVTLMQQHLVGQQWIAVAISVAAAFLLSTAGGIIPARALVGMLMVCLTYSLSDIHIVKSVNALADVDRLHASVVVAAMSYVVCGAAALAVLPFARGDRADWRWALPFSGAWYAAMLLLFACFAMTDVVFGNILQSLRGPISVGLGALLARAGLEHLERRTTRWVFLRRAGAAGLMVLAVVLYKLAG